MATKNINARVTLKHDIEANWITAGKNDFCPLAGEVIIFDPDDSCAMIRYKIGRWANEEKTELVNINDLPFESNVYVGRDEPVNAPAGFMWVDTSDDIQTIVFYVRNESAGGEWLPEELQADMFTYEAESGMTFREWVNSEYNIHGWECDANDSNTDPEGNHIYGVVHYNLSLNISGEDSERYGAQDCDSEIIANHTYDTQYRP